MEVNSRMIWLSLVTSMVLAIIIVSIVVEIMFDEMSTIVIRSEEIVGVVARGVLFIVLVNVIITWDVSHSGLVTVNHCGEPVHEEVCDSIVAHR